MVTQSSEFVKNTSKEKQAWFAIWVFVGLISLPLAVGIGAPLVPIFPTGAVVLGLFLYFRTPHLYIGYVWWMLFLSNLIRRLIDYRAGYLTPGPWGLTAVLVASISLLTVGRYLPVIHRRGGLPFVLTLSGIGYAFLVGVYRHPLESMVNGTLDWVCPVACAFHIFVHWRDYPKMKQVILKTVLWGVLFMGVYGILQYIFAPPWEQFWLENTGATSFGSPEPFSIRVASSTGSPQAFATIMLAGLIIILCDAANPISYVASGFGYLSFILSMARSVWLSAAITIPLFLLSLKPSHQIRMFVVGAVIFSIVAITLLSWEPVYEKFYLRFETFLNLDDDISFQARRSGYSALWSLAIIQFFGQGIGFSLKNSGTALGANDGSLFPLLFTFGWLGLGFYLTGFSILFMKLLQIPDARADLFIGACRIVVLCIIFQSSLNSVFGGSFGLILWSFLGIGLAGHKYRLLKAQTSRPYHPDP